MSVAAQKLTYTWHQIPVRIRDDGQPDLARLPNISTIQNLQGKVNSSEFDGYGAGSVLFLGASGKLVLPQTATANNYYWDITYVLGVRDYGEADDGGRIGWNYAYDPIAKAWDLYTTNGNTSGDKMYRTGDLNQLFVAGW